MSPEQAVSISCGIIVVVLTILHLSIENKWIGVNLQTYSLTLGSNPTFVIQNVTLSMDEGWHPFPIIMNVYGLRNHTVIFSSPLSKENEEAASHLKFNNMQNISLEVKNNTISHVNVSFDNLDTGEYKGWIFFTRQNSFAIPFTVSTEPKVAQSFILVFIGVFSGIGLWELFFFLDRIYNSRTATTIRIKAKALSDEVAANYNDIAIRKEQRAQNIKNRYLERTAQIVGLDIASIVLAIVVGFVTLMSDGYLTGLIEINPIDVFVLVITGIGIGNLKALVDN